MKEKGVTKIALILLVLVCVFAIVACSDNVNTDGDVCKHIYTEKADAKYLKSAATCTEKAVYYKSCSLCGEKDTATFEYGEALGHAYGDDDDGKCTICGQQIVGTEGVVYVSYDTYAVVTGYIGTESDVKIAAFYKDLPVIRIENKAFYNCRSLTSVTIPDSVTSIGGSAFSYCTSLTSVTIPDGVTSINSGAFYNCTSLKSVTIGNNVKSIGYGAFRDCTALKTVYYKGTAADWGKISIGSQNSNITNTKRYYYSESKPTGSGNYWHYVDGKPTVWPSDE